MSAGRPSRGEVWLVKLDPTEGRGQAGSRPALVVSVDPFNHGPVELVTILPITTRRRGVPFHVAVNPPEGGLARESYIKCEDIRSVSTGRLTRRFGGVSQHTMDAVEDRVRILLGL
ncbi:MAG: type II toxin-antitoxin system PemK/MazF family toxin [Bryobacteraceae bacterium]|jgi:mRNA interferase MazF